MSSLKEDSLEIIRQAIEDSQPYTAVKKVVDTLDTTKGRLILIAIGKASWSMAKAATDILKEKVDDGLVITKYGHSQGALESIEIVEAGHPTPDQFTIEGTKKALKLVENLKEDDTVLFLVSGGGSSLFELPKEPLTLKDIIEVNEQLLGKGASITEINTLRKKISLVKGGRFANLCYPAKVVSIILSDIINDPIDMIASGPSVQDESTNDEAVAIIRKYNLKNSGLLTRVVNESKEEIVSNSVTYINGSVDELCNSAYKKAKDLGYEPIILTCSLQTEARSAGEFLGEVAYYHRKSKRNIAFICGGETIVNLKGNGLGGRNQELSLASSKAISGLDNIAIFSFGSDGTDGPTDAAGGYVDGNTLRLLQDNNINLVEVLDRNDSYNALKITKGLIKTGPTGTNVNDLYVVLIRKLDD